MQSRKNTARAVFFLSENRRNAIRAAVDIYSRARYNISMELLLENPELKVEAAVIDDVVRFEHARVIAHDEHAAIVKAGETYKCVFDDIDRAREYIARFGIRGKACLLNMPADAPAILGLDAAACKTFAYLAPMPPLPDGSVAIKRLAPSLAETVREAYVKHGAAGYTVEQVAALMRDKGIFGAIVGGKLAGFVGRHADGNIGMLEVFEPFRRRGLGRALAEFMIAYVMTFGRTPICDVFTDNAASLSMQDKLGMTAARGLTFWGALGEGE